jgi:hypothetical protein
MSVVASGASRAHNIQYSTAQDNQLMTREEGRGGTNIMPEKGKDWREDVEK